MKKRRSADQIVGLLRQADGDLGKGANVPDGWSSASRRTPLADLSERTENGRQLRILVVIDAFTRECLAIEVARSFTARDVLMTRRSCSPCGCARASAER